MKAADPRTDVLHTSAKSEPRELTEEEMRLQLEEGKAAARAHAEKIRKLWEMSQNPSKPRTHSRWGNRRKGQR